MKDKSLYSAALLLIFSLLTTALFAQRVIVEGNNLKIGLNNALSGENLGRPMGNAIGLQNMLYSAHALAVGVYDTIDSNSSYSVTLGVSNFIRGEAAMGFGRSVKVFGNDNIGIGHHIRVNGQSGSMVIGGGIEGTNGADAFLVNDSSNSLAVGFNSTRPTLFISELPNDYGQNILDRTGRVAIGNVTPQAKLHIRSDMGEDAGIILQPSDPTENNAFIQFRDAQHSIMVDEHGIMNITAGNGNLLGVNSTNFKVDENLVQLGLDDEKKLTFTTAGPASIGLNAFPYNGYYLRRSYGSSYVMEMSDTTFKLRTAVYMDPRNDVIGNWRDALTVKPSGAVILNGKVGVNTENTTSDYALAVDGGVITTKVHIQDVNDWRDDVFEEDYPLMPLDEVEAYVTENKHLPGIPSEAEVKADGYDLAEMQAALLGKVEELTLYVLRQQREIDSLRTLVTVRFGYDACGNRVSRTLEFSKSEDPGLSSGEMSANNAPQWQASMRDGFADVEAMLFPNPTEGGFFVSLTGGEVPYGTRATLCTPEGKILEERVVTSNTEEFDLGGKPAGVYLLRLATDRETKVWKVIKRD